VERAWDRWCYAQQHALRAARERFKPHLAVAVARTAWSNYWDLCQEAERIRSRLRPGGTAAARRG
jgi:predicted DsbA family dithiol-disulfide isomerase